MTDNITVTGVVANDPQFTHGASGVSITRFRLASTQRRFDKNSNSWVDGDTNWYNVSAFRRLSDNLVTSVKKTDRVIVSGRLRVRAWENGEKSGTAVDIDADTVGHDLLWGTASFNRVTVSRTHTDVQESFAGGMAEETDGAGWSNAPMEQSSETAVHEGLGAEPSAPFGNSESLVQHYPDPVTVNS